MNRSPAPTEPLTTRWDIFCRVIDNHGDAGVCWRLAAELAARGDTARLWIDDPSALAWMAPTGKPGVSMVRWTAQPPDLAPGDAVIEAFGCDPPPAFVARMAAAVPPPLWINLEYLSAEPYVERSHGLPSPVMQGPGAGLVKRFFYPGFTPRTGGLIRERDLEARMAAFAPQAWLRDRLGIARADSATLASLFCYEPAALPTLLRRWASADEATQLLVAAGRGAAATRSTLAQLAASDPNWNARARLQLHWLPLLSQPDYDHLLWSCDLNFVRGEDSLVRALLAGRPFVWHIYPQDDGAHWSKLNALLDWLEAPASLQAFHEGWNATNAASPLALPDVGWRATAAAARARAHALPDLVDGLRSLAAERARM